MMFAPLVFGNGLTIDALVDSGAYISAIVWSELDRIQEQALASIFEIDDPPNFENLSANGQLEKPIATATLKFYMGNNTCAEHFDLMKNMTEPTTGLHSKRHSSVVVEAIHGLIRFPHSTMQAKNAAIGTSSKTQPVPTHNKTSVPPMTTKTITEFVDHPSKWPTTGTVTSVSKFAEAARLIISYSNTTISDIKAATRITDTPYLIKKNTQIAEFSVVTPKGSKFIKLVDTAILSMLLEADPDVSTYLNELLKTNRPEQQNNTFWLLTHKKIRAKLRIRPQYRHGSVKNYLNCKKKKNSTRRLTQNHE